MKVKEQSEKVGLKLNIQKTKVMASGPITSWQKDGETVETVSDFILGGSKITADSDCNHFFLDILFVLCSLYFLPSSFSLHLRYFLLILNNVIMVWFCMCVFCMCVCLPCLEYIVLSCSGY